MNEFQKKLTAVLGGPPFEGNQRALALFSGVDRGQLHRVFAGTRAATPELVGRLCGTLPPGDAASLLKAFLDDIVEETKRAEPLPPATDEERERRARWRRPLSDLNLAVSCSPKRMAG